MKEVFGWYGPQYTPNISRENLMVEYVVPTAAIQLSNVKKHLLRALQLLKPIGILKYICEVQQIALVLVK